MYKAYFDIGTVALYILVGILGYLCIRNFIVPWRTVDRGHSSLFTRKCRHWEYAFVLLYTLLAAFRLVAPNIGGADAIDYVENFNDIFIGGLDRQGNVDMEIGFQWFTRTVKNITDNYKIYFFLIYGFIAWSYVFFINRKCPRGVCYIPFILLMYPFLKSFTSIRSSMAIGFILIGLTLIDKRKLLSLLFILTSLLFHRMSILFIMIWPFYFVMKRYLENESRMRFIITSLLGVVVTFILATAIQNYVYVVGFFDNSTTMYYLTASMGNSIFSRFPMFIGQLTLWIVVTLLYNRIQWDNNTTFLRTLFIYDIWIIPVGLVLGMWRSIEYFYIIRLSLWCVCIYVLIRNHSKGYAFVVKAGTALLFIAWLVFRVYKEWDDAKLSPYIFDMF
ncbi:EpsG family protein [Prevotella communis]|uniref:EpsG family protein n=1 Tax=Prevotella communis TaxID=2913614 RepID=UPI003D69EE22